MSLGADCHGYGPCPSCGDEVSPKTTRERRPNGFTKCGACGINSPSREWVGRSPMPPDLSAKIADFAAANGTTKTVDVIKEIGAHTDALGEARAPMHYSDANLGQALVTCGMQSSRERDAYIACRAAAARLMKAEGERAAAQKAYVAATQALNEAIEDTLPKE